MSKFIRLSRKTQYLMILCRKRMMALAAPNPTPATIIYLFSDGCRLCYLSTVGRKRNLWVTDAFEWRPEVRLAADERRIPPTRLFVFVASRLRSQLAIPGKRYAVYGDGGGRFSGNESPSLANCRISSPPK